MPKIAAIKARQILDSRATPTIETKVTLDNNIQAIDSVPSGASKGTLEALELRDNDPKVYGGQGVLTAVKIVNETIAPKIIGMDSGSQSEIDQILVQLDGTANKSKLGANSMLSVSMAVARAHAMSQNRGVYQYISELSHKLGIPQGGRKIPIPLFNVINGGKHGAGNLNFQEFFIIPASNKKYSDGLRLGVEIYQKVKEILIYRNAVHSVGDEGGFAPNLSTNIDALEALKEAIRTSIYKLGVDAFLGLDLAASTFFTRGGYQLIDRAQPYQPSEFIEYLSDLQKEYNLLILEDPFQEEEWYSWIEYTSRFGDQVYIVGDDLLVTNINRLKMAIDKKACNSILVKLNQIGTITETLEVVRQARMGGFKIVVSHRSGETTDSFSADFAVGIQADYVKFGAPARGERVVKYNRLLEIDEELNGAGK
ncbi:phosphopyruvate hydratase [Candidatus Gottesmanbacteria bacterium]|nr:phosphopyruvate hydratase [Candidatus Gottesmanbacteria bacterium]